MKKRIQAMIIFVAMICMSISGCNEKYATPISTSVTEPIAKTTVTTVTSAEEVLETTAIPSTAVWTETVTEAVVAVTTVTAPQTDPPKVNSEQIQTEIPNEYYESTEPMEEIVITDDTKLTHAEFSTEENMQRLTSELNVHYEKTGMTLDPTLNKHNTGWMFTYQGEIDKTAVRSYNEHWDRIVVGMDEQIEAFMAMSGATYNDLRFYYYAELQPDNEYHIYFCYQ